MIRRTGAIEVRAGPRPARIQSPLFSKVDDTLNLRYLTPEVLAASQVFDPDIAEVTTGINTLNNPILPRLYDAGWREWN